MGLTLAECERLGIAHLFPVREETTTPMARPKSKYRAVATTYNGVRYHSKAEAVRAERLDFERNAGLIRFWVGQPTFRLGCPENVYKGDFLVIGITGAWTEDVKGIETPKFKRDKKLWARYGPCPLKIICRGKIVEVIDPEQIKMQGDDIDARDAL